MRPVLPRLTRKGLERPGMIGHSENGWKHWTGEHAKWTVLAETALELDDMQSFERCMKNADLCLLYREEELGHVTIVTGRQGFGINPTGSVQVGPSLQRKIDGECKQ